MFAPSASPSATVIEPGCSAASAATIASNTPSTKAVKVWFTKSEPARSNSTYWKKPLGPECVCVPEIMTFRAVYLVGPNLAASFLTSAIFWAWLGMPASMETKQMRLAGSEGSATMNARAKSRVWMPAASCDGLACAGTDQRAAAGSAAAERRSGRT